MKKRILSILIMAVAASSYAASPNGRCSMLLVSSPQKTNGSYASTFSATSVIDLDFSLLFTTSLSRKLPGAHVARIDVFTPKGNLYERMSVPFASSKSLNKARVEGYRDLRDIVQLSSTSYKSKGYLRLKSTLPIAGTPVITSSLYGNWSAVAYIDKDSAPCAATAQFTVSQ